MGGVTIVYIFEWHVSIFNKKIAIALRDYNAAFLFWDGPVDPFWQESWYSGDC